MVSASRSADFEQLALPLLASLYNHAFWLTRNHAEAEDLVQETFSKALRAFDSFQARHQLQGLDLPHPAQYLPHLPAPASPPPVPSFSKIIPTRSTPPIPARPRKTHLIRLDNQAALQRALEQLEPPLREALLLCDVEEVKYRDIALILDIPIGTVMSRISRARRALRQLLQPQLGESQ